MAFIEIARRLYGMSLPQRQYALNRFVQRAFEGDEGLFVARLDYNAKLFTYLRKEKIWPPY